MLTSQGRLGNEQIGKEANVISQTPEELLFRIANETSWNVLTKANSMDEGTPNAKKNKRTTRTNTTSSLSQRAKRAPLQKRTTATRAELFFFLVFFFSFFPLHSLSLLPHALVSRSLHSLTLSHSLSLTRSLTRCALVKTSKHRHRTYSSLLTVTHKLQPFRRYLRTLYK